MGKPIGNRILTPASGLITPANVGALMVSPPLYLSSGGSTTYFTAAYGSYSITGDLSKELTKVVVSPGTYSISGDIIKAKVNAVVAPGIYSITAGNTGANYKVIVTPGTYSTAGKLITTAVGIDAAPGTYLITGYPFTIPGQIIGGHFLPFHVTFGQLKSF